MPKNVARFICHCQLFMEILKKNQKMFKEIINKAAAYFPASSINLKVRALSIFLSPLSHHGLARMNLYLLYPSQFLTYSDPQDFQRNPRPSLCLHQLCTSPRWRCENPLFRQSPPHTGGWLWCDHHPSPHQQMAHRSAF